MNIKPLRVGFADTITVPAIAAVCFFLLTLASACQYGFFGDEFYYIACSKHPDWGYVDHPPLVALLTLVSTTVFGETLFGLRFMSGLAGGLTVLLSAHIARMLGGGRFSQSLAALSICFATVFPALSSFFSMNPVDIMLCNVFIIVFVKTIEAPPSPRWMALGLLLGAGLLNKYTFLVLGFSLMISLLLTKRWRVLRSPWIYASGIMGFVIFSPHILWQIQNDWPTGEFIRNATEYKNLSLSPLAFFTQLTIALNPFTLPLWISGLIYLLTGRRMKEYRFLGWMVIVFLFIYLIQNSKFYYVIPIFPLLLSSGAIAVEQFAQKIQAGWPRWTAVSTLIVSGTVLMPLAVPILPVEQFVTYSKTLGLWNGIRMERGEGETLPLHFVHRIGWEELVDSVAQAYNALPQGEKAQCAILGSWYGIAGAIDHFGPAYGLPNALCAHNTYWMWGTRNYAGEVVLAVGFNERTLHQFFESVEQVGYNRNPYAFDRAIHLCKKLKVPLKELWPRLKNFG